MARRSGNRVRHLLPLLLGLSLLASSTARADSSHLDRVLAAKELRVCAWPDYYGISYRHPHSQEMTGVDADMARALAKDLGVGLRFVDSSFALIVDDVTRDRCDIAMFAIAITPAKAEKMHFAPIHLASDIQAITTRSHRRIRGWSDIDQPGVVVAVMRGTSIETAAREKFHSATLVVVDNARARDQAVQSGRADVFLTIYPYARRMLDTADWARAVSPAAPVHPLSHAYAMRHGDASWHARIDAFVASIKRDGRLLASARRHKLEAIVAAP